MFLRSLQTGRRHVLALAPSVLRPFSSSPRTLEHFLNADAKTLDRVISENASDRLVLIDFYAEWCQPCKMLSPILEKLTTGDAAKSGSGRPLDLVTVDTDDQPELAAQYKIRSLPTVIAFKDGKPVSQFMGAMPETSVRNFLNGL